MIGLKSIIMVTGFFIVQGSYAQETSIQDQSKVARSSLTPEQRHCLERRLGRPGSGMRPTRSRLLLVMEQCEVKANPEDVMARPPLPPESLTLEQRLCLQIKVGQPGDGSEHTQQEIEQAIRDCDVTPTEESEDETFRDVNNNLGPGGINQGVR